MNAGWLYYFCATYGLQLIFNVLVIKSSRRLMGGPRVIDIHVMLGFMTWNSSEMVPTSVFSSTVEITQIELTRLWVLGHL